MVYRPSASSSPGRKSEVTRSGGTKVVADADLSFATQANAVTAGDCALLPTVEATPSSPDPKTG
jgi:hypothetical protein